MWFKSQFLFLFIYFRLCCLRCYVRFSRLTAIGGYPCSSVGKESVCNAGDLGFIPGSGRSPGEGNGNPLQYSCLENPTDRRAWEATVYGVPRVRHDLATKPPPCPEANPNGQIAFLKKNSSKAKGHLRETALTQQAFTFFRRQSACPCFSSFYVLSPQPCIQLLRQRKQ